MKYNQIILIFILVLAVVVSYALDYTNKYINFFVATGLLGQEIYDTFKFRKLSNSSPTFQLKSNEWLGGMAWTGFILYWFSDDGMNLFNIIAILEVLVFGGLYIARTKTLTYTIEDSGIRNLLNGKLLEQSTITDIKFNEDRLAIDTTKYQNDLIVKSSDLKTPSWDELKNRLVKLNKDVC